MDGKSTMATVNVFDGKGAIAGRLASHIVKLILAGQTVIVLNAQQVVISGKPRMVVAKYAARRGITNKADPSKAAKWPKRPDYLFKKIVSGMMPKRTSRSKAALGRLKAYLGTPKEYEGHAKIDSKTGHKKLTSASLTLQELCSQL